MSANASSLQLQVAQYLGIRIGASSASSSENVSVKIRIASVDVYGKPPYVCPQATTLGSSGVDCICIENPDVEYVDRDFIWGKPASLSIFVGIRREAPPRLRKVAPVSVTEVVTSASASKFEACL